MGTPPIPHVAGALSVAPRPAERRCRSALLRRGWERPPISACLDRHRGGWRCASPSSPPLRGRSQPAVLCRKAMERRFEKTDYCAGERQRPGSPLVTASVVVGPFSRAVPGNGAASAGRCSSARRTGGRRADESPPSKRRPTAFPQPRSAALARPAFTMRRCRCGGQRGRSPPRQPRSGTREAWPQRVCWLSRLSGQIRPPTREVPKADRPPPAAPPTRRATATASRSKRRSCRTQNGRIFLFPVVHECRHSAPSRLAAIRSPIHSSTSASIQPTDRAPSPTGWGKRPSTRHS